MTTRIKKVKLKGNESFNFREGWLRKGMRCVEADETLFSRDDVMALLRKIIRDVCLLKYLGNINASYNVDNS